VIYPPVKVPVKLPTLSSRKEYYIYLGRLKPFKRVDLVIEAFSKLDRKLLIAGEGRDGNRLRKLASPNIEFLGYISEEEKAKLMKKAKAFIFAGADEDFGIAPVEAMAYGVPVIAYYSGGLKETVIDGKTGVFFKEQTTDSLVNAIRRFETMTINPKDCHKQAKLFSEEKFEREFVNFIKRSYAKHQQI
jgi:glycosyltransferase involved in cell wall biosynthesis